eukprot:5100961-Amphidinium_carterae.2
MQGYPHCVVAPALQGVKSRTLKKSMGGRSFRLPAEVTTSEYPYTLSSVQRPPQARVQHSSN